MTAPTLGDLFAQFHHTAFRYEALPAYVVDEEADSIRAWLDGAPRPERSVRTDEWLAIIAATTAQGRQWRRVRVVDRPLPEYVRWEITAYVENAAVGDQLRLVERDRASTGRDFWLFDGGTETAIAAWMDYDDAGRFRGIEIEQDPATLADLHCVAEALYEEGTPLAVWLSRTQEQARG